MHNSTIQHYKIVSFAVRFADWIEDVLYEMRDLRPWEWGFMWYGWFFLTIELFVSRFIDIIEELDTTELGGHIVWYEVEWNGLCWHCTVVGGL